MKYRTEVYGALSKKQQTISVVVILGLAVLTLVLGIVVGTAHRAEGISELMRDAVLHEDNKMSLFGIVEVNPALISAYIVTAVLLLFALIVRIFVIPRFKMVPGKFQLLLETWIGYFDNLAKQNSPHRNGFLGAYLFAAGSYIFVGTFFELFGVQAITVAGHPITLGAPLADINAAISIGCLSYIIILSGGIVGNGMRGVGATLKDFSLPISMSFRLFGALLSGLLVTELVYYYVALSFVLPVVVGVLFTLLHALIQAYVLTMLTALFYGEVSEPSHKPKTIKKSKK